MTYTVIDRMASDNLCRGIAWHQAQIDADTARADWIDKRATALTVTGADYDPSTGENIGEAVGNCPTEMQRRLTQAARTRDARAVGELVLAISIKYWADRARDRAEDEYDTAHDGDWGEE